MNKEVNGLGIALAEIANESTATERRKLCARLMSLLYPTQTSILIQTDAPPDDLAEDLHIILRA